MTNFTIQTLIGFPTFCVALILLTVMYKRNMIWINNFIICGSLLAIAQFFATGIFWYDNPDINAIANFSKIAGILFTPVFVLFLFGVLQMIVAQNISTIVSRQRVLGVVLLSLITFGFYTPFWFIKNQVIRKAGTIWIVLFTFFLTLSFYVHLYLYAESNAFGLAVWLTVDLLTIALGIANAMNFRTIILKENPKTEINPFLTFLLGIFYLQYQINKLGNEQE